MWCCWGSTTDSDMSYGQQIVNSGFPGRRGLVKTAGNALQAAPLTTHDRNLIQVTVPPGVIAGQTIHVRAPDGRLIEAQVPYGMTSGSVFCVRDPNAFDHAPRVTNSPVTVEAQVDQPFSTALDDSVNLSHTPMAVAMPVPEQPVQSAYAEPIISAPEQALPLPLPPPNNPQNLTTAAPPGKKLMLVRVPAGVSAGEVLHVRVPGEDRLIAATVPANVSEFHVSYDDPSTPSTNSEFRQSRQSQNSNGSVILPMIGGVALGAAAMSMLDHFHNQARMNDDANMVDEYNSGDGDWGGDTGAFDGF